MKKCFSLLLFFLFLSFSISAQIGFTVAPTQGLASEWQILTENYITGKRTDFLKYGTTAVVDYTFQLKAPEWQVAPALHVMRSHFIFRDYDFEVYSLGLQSNFNFTPFKEAQEKEFSNMRMYFQLSPGLDFVRMQYKEWDREGEVPYVVSKLADQKMDLNGGLNFWWTYG